MGLKDERMGRKKSFRHIERNSFSSKVWMKGTLEKRKHEKKESRNGRMEEEKVERVKNR